MDAFQAGLLTKRFSRRLLSFASSRCLRRFRTGILLAKGTQEHIMRYTPANLILMCCHLYQCFKCLCIFLTNAEYHSDDACWYSGTLVYENAIDFFFNRLHFIFPFSKRYYHLIFRKIDRNRYIRRSAFHHRFCCISYRTN